MKKLSRLAAILLLFVLLTACGEAAPPAASGSSPAADPGSGGPSQPIGTPTVPVPQPDTSSPAVPDGPLHIAELTVELPRELDTTAARKAMQALPEAMAGHNVIIDTVSVSFGPAYSATADALAGGAVQLAFLPAEDFLELGGMTLLMTDAYPDPEGSLSPGASAQICAGPSDYGTKLAEAACSRATPLTWAELDHARWGVLSADSLSGHRCLRLWLEDNYEDNGVSDLSQVTVYDSWTALLQAAAAEEIDLFPLPAALRDSFALRWNTDFARPGDFRDEVRTIGVSAGVCTWTAAAAPEDSAVNDPRFLQALSAVINDLFPDSASQKAAIGAECYVPAGSGDLDPLRRLLLGEG